MARIATLSNGAIFVRSTIGINGIGAVVFLVGLAVVTCEVGADLSSNTSAVANLEVFNLGANLYDFADDFVADAQRKGDIFSPSASYSVDVGCANATRIDSNVDIVVLELLQWKLWFESGECSCMREFRFKPTSCRLNVLQLPFLISVTANASVVSG